jgi:hypothetical protein
LFECDNDIRAVHPLGRFLEQLPKLVPERRNNIPAQFGRFLLHRAPSRFGFQFQECSNSEARRYQYGGSSAPPLDVNLAVKPHLLAESPAERCRVRLCQTPTLTNQALGTGASTTFLILQSAICIFLNPNRGLAASIH